MSNTITLSETQLEAAELIEKWYKGKEQTFYLAGYAGTGKTTIVKEVIKKLRGEKPLNVVYCAFTGKAASVLASKGNRPASTVHSLIYVLEEQQVDDGKGNKILKKVFVKRPVDMGEEFRGSSSKDIPLIYTSDLIVLDECSMISEELYEDLLTFGLRVLILGDPGQLPPITGQTPFGKSDYFLTEIQRQAQDSNIIQLATKARKKEKIEKCKFDDAVVGSLDYFEEFYEKGTQVLCGTNKTRFQYNAFIRKHLLLKTDSYYPVRGEEIICLENNKNIGLFNGQVVTCVDHDLLNYEGDANELSYKDLKSVKLTIEDDRGNEAVIDADFRYFKASSSFDGVKLKALQKEKEMFMKSKLPFDFAHCITVHKSQGSQWENVIVIDESSIFKNMKAKWLYTAITRASEKVFLLK